MPTKARPICRKAALTLLAACCLCGTVGAQQAAPLARVLPLKEALAQVAGGLSTLQNPVAVYHVGSRPEGPLLQDYVASLLAVHLRQRGFPAQRVAYRAAGGPEGLPGCFLHVLRVEGASVFVLPGTSLQDGERRLRVVAYEVATGQELLSMERAFHLPAALEPLVAGKRDRMGQQDRKWCRLFEEMFPPARASSFERTLHSAEAEFFYENGIWEAAGTRYLDSASPSPDRHFMRAVVSLQLAGRGQLAHAHLQDVLNQHPDSGALYALGGWLMRRRNRPSDALMMLEQARLVDMAREGLYVYARALTALEEDDPEQAERFLTRSTEMLPGKLFAQLETARFFWNHSRLEKALEHYRRATKTEGCTAETWAELGMLLDASDDARGAIAALRQAFRLRNDSAAITRHLASLLRGQGDYDGALEVLRRAAEVNPCSAALLAAYGDGAAGMWLIDEAEAQFRRAAQVEADFPYATARLAGVLALQRRYGQAQPLLTKLLAQHPDYLPARLELARLLTEVGQFEEAEAALTEVAKDPEHEPEARIALAELHLASGRPEEAVRNAQIAVSCRSDAASYASLCDAFLAAGQNEKAQSAAMAGLEQSADSARVHLALARVRQVQGRTDEALNEAERALELDPYSVEALRLSGALRRERGELRECAALWQRALALNPWYAQLHFDLSRLLGERLGDTRAAIEHYARYLELERARIEAGG